MCSIDDAERFAIYETWRCRARKPHKCSECGRDISAGETYQNEKGLLPGDGWMMTKVCSHCLVGATWLVEECGGYCLQQVVEEIDEHAREYRSRPLHRIAIGARRKWQRFDGRGLMPLPAMPPLSKPARAA